MAVTTATNIDPIPAFKLEPIAHKKGAGPSGFREYMTPNAAPHLNSGISARIDQ
jgi:hypothetical protein